MKIKLSKTQWLEMGKVAGWMMNESEYKIIRGIFKYLSDNGGKPNVQNGRTLSVEFGMNDPIWGDAWIDVGLNRDNDLYIERYYDSEYSQDEAGLTKIVPVNYENPQETLAEVKKIINFMKTTS